jgi:hypothetical protein
MIYKDRFSETDISWQDFAEQNLGIYRFGPTA